MFCAISGQIPSEAVVAKTSGLLFEKRLIVTALKVEEKCPVTNDRLTLEDLIDVKASKVSQPKPASSTSVPGLLHTLQNEWDETVLESFQLRQQLDATRKELAHALYQHDAACRIIARLKRERDEAYQMVNAYKANGGTVHTIAAGEEDASNGKSNGAMDVAESTGGDDHEVGVSEEVKSELNATCKALSAPRKQRKPSSELLSKENMMLIDQSEVYYPIKKGKSQSGITAMALTTDNRVVTGDNYANIVVSEWASTKIQSKLSGHRGLITSLAVSSDGRTIFSASEDKTIKFWSANASGGFPEKFSYDRHKAIVTGLALHPSSNYLISTSAAGDWHFLDVVRGQCLVSVPAANSGVSYSKCTFHPDGLLLATGETSGVIKIWDVREQKDAITLPTASAAVSSLNASENGFYLAAGYADGSAKVWDLRKTNCVRLFELGNGAVQNVAFDFSGAYLAVAGGETSSTIQIKAVKDWTNLATISSISAPVTGMAWAEHARSLIVSSMDNGVHVLTKG